MYERDKTSDIKYRSDAETMRKYGDILDVEWNGVRKHAHAPISLRAAMFAPFAALTGFEDEIYEKARFTSRETILSDNRKEEIDYELQKLCKALTQNKDTDVKTFAEFTFFVKDSRKEGGKYVTKEGFVSKIDVYNQMIYMESGDLIPINSIVDVTCRESVR